MTTAHFSAQGELAVGSGGGKRVNPLPLLLHNLQWPMAS